MAGGVFWPGLGAGGQPFYPRWDVAPGKLTCLAPPRGPKATTTSLYTELPSPHWTPLVYYPVDVPCRFCPVAPGFHGVLRNAGCSRPLGLIMMVLLRHAVETGGHVFPFFSTTIRTVLLLFKYSWQSTGLVSTCRIHNINNEYIVNTCIIHHINNEY